MKIARRAARYALQSIVAFATYAHQIGAEAIDRLVPALMVSPATAAGAAAALLASLLTQQLQPHRYLARMRIHKNRLLLIHLVAGMACASMLAACGPRAESDVGGTLSGLDPGLSVTVSDNADSITLSQNGGFHFPVSVDADNVYNVSVVTQPPGQTCTVTNGSGTLDDDADPVGNIVITCVDT